LATRRGVLIGVSRLVVGRAASGLCGPPCFTGQTDSRARLCRPTGCNIGPSTAHSASRPRHDPQIFGLCRAWAGPICACCVPTHLAQPKITGLDAGAIDPTHRDAVLISVVIWTHGANNWCFLGPNNTTLF
jgi:hypothetical protein